MTDNLTGTSFNGYRISSSGSFSGLVWLDLSTYGSDITHATLSFDIHVAAKASGSYLDFSSTYFSSMVWYQASSQIDIAESGTEFTPSDLVSNASSFSGSVSYTFGQEGKFASFGFCFPLECDRSNFASLYALLANTKISIALGAEWA